MIIELRDRLRRDEVEHLHDARSTRQALGCGSGSGLSNAAQKRQCLFLL